MRNYTITYMEEFQMSDELAEFISKDQELWAAEDCWAFYLDDVFGEAHFDGKWPEIEKVLVANGVTLERLQNADICRNCRFYDSGVYDGGCRRYAPAIGKSKDGFYPSVRHTDWCGEFDRQDDPEKQQ